MAIKLIINSLETTSVPKELVLEDVVISVGRSQGCTVELEHEELSRRHFVIKYEEAGYFIIDEGSRHGTFINDKLLEPEKPYFLSYSQVVRIPGFIIQIINDNQIPKAEKTTVVARKLMGKLFEDVSAIDQAPYLLDCKKAHHYIFKAERSSFVMGRAHHLDFVVEDDQINKEHLSFIRDITGVRAIVINEADLKVNDVVIKGSVLLRHGDKIKIGLSDFLFFEYEDDKLHCDSKINETISANDSEVTISDNLTILHNSREMQRKRKLPGINSLDRFVVTIFLVVISGISWFFFSVLVE